MNSKTTGVWFVIAAALLAFIFVFEHYLRPVAAGPALLLPNLRPAVVTSVQVFPAGAQEISADRTNGGWVLTKPVSYPAQAAAIEALLDALQTLTPAKISAAELRENKNSETEFGFENPQAMLAIAAGSQSWQLKVGNKTAPGDQVYLRVVGTDGAFVADAGWLNLIPHAADEWRDTSLVNAGPGGFDWIVLTNNTKGIAIELRRDPTNHLWRMIRPLPARADAGHITDALQQLASASVTRFITDDPKADLAAFGLQPADLDLWLGRGTNLVAAVHVGKSPTNDATQVYAQREDWNAVFTTAREPLAPWRGVWNDFRDSRLFELTAPVAEIEVRGENNFILREHGSNDWQIAGEKFPADAGSIQQFIKTLAGLRIAEFAGDAVTAHDLAAYGLAAPQSRIILRSKAGDTNAVIAELDFGAVQTNDIFVLRPDENCIYAIPWQDFHRAFPEGDWQFRDRNIWNFNVNDVAQITIHQDGKTRQIVRNGPDKWSLAPGSQGFIEGKYIEQSAERFGQLAAVVWIGRNLPESDMTTMGFKPEGLQITARLKNGNTFTVAFGAPTVAFGAHDNGALAAVTLDGERWAFEFPPVLYQFVLSYLTIPAKRPVICNPVSGANAACASAGPAVPRWPRRSRWCARSSGSTAWACRIFCSGGWWKPCATTAWSLNFPGCASASFTG